MFAESTWRRRSHLKMANAGTFLFQYLDIAAIPTATAFKKGARGVWLKTKTRCETMTLILVRCDLEQWHFRQCFGKTCVKHQMFLLA